MFIYKNSAIFCLLIISSLLLEGANNLSLMSLDPDAVNVLLITFNKLLFFSPLIVHMISKEDMVDLSISKKGISSSVLISLN